MATQLRVYYACKSVGVSKCGENTFTMIHGLQSCGINTRFNLDSIFEIGQLESYEISETIPDVEVTMEKVLDGYPLIYHLATKGATSASLSGRSNVKSTVGLSIFSDLVDSASGTPLAQCTVSGVYPSTLSYTLPVQGPFTESITLVGNNKVWNNTFSITAFNNNDAPLAGTASGGVNRREDLLLGTGNSKLPSEIPGVSGDYYLYLGSDGNYPAHLQSIRVSTNLGREQLFELGRRGPYHRFVTFPTEVTCEIETISTLGDNIQALETSENNLTDQPILLKIREGTTLDLGTKNKLSSITYGGGNAGQNGGNDTITYSYTNFNSLKVTHPADPSALT
jgi:hypothetical protein